MTKQSSLDQSTVRQKQSTYKMITRARRLIVCRVSKEPRVTSKELKATLTLANVNVNESGELGVHGTAMVCTEMQEESNYSPKKLQCCSSTFAKDHVNKPKYYWK